MIKILQLNEQYKLSVLTLRGPHMESQHDFTSGVVQSHTCAHSMQQTQQLVGSSAFPKQRQSEQKPLLCKKTQQTDQSKGQSYL